MIRYNIFIDWRVPFYGLYGGQPAVISNPLTPGVTEQLRRVLDPIAFSGLNNCSILILIFLP